jgi:hypothetical protein
MIYITEKSYGFKVGDKVKFTGKLGKYTNNNYNLLKRNTEYTIDEIFPGKVERIHLREVQAYGFNAGDFTKVDNSKENKTESRMTEARENASEQISDIVISNIKRLSEDGYSLEEIKERFASGEEYDLTDELVDLAAEFLDIKE